jgi:hypothetical protein
MSFSDNSYPRFDWTLFILSEELHINNTDPGWKSFDIMIEVELMNDCTSRAPVLNATYHY